jgi:hypothetical protein
MTSSRQIGVNRLNAQLSTGPVTVEGSRRNAIRHGLTAETHPRRDRERAALYSLA